MSHHHHPHAHHHHDPFAQGGHGSPSNVSNPRVPYHGEIPGGLQAGSRIHVKGYVTPYSQQFQVNLLTHSGDIALHINPRFNQNEVVRNTNRGGWQNEEKHGVFPFIKGQPFDMYITPEHDHFKVAVNGNHIFDYHYRIPLHEIKRISIEGEVECHNLAFHGQGGPAPSRAIEFNSPPIPASLPIQGGFHPGKMVQIYGSVPHHANRFYINLQLGPGNDSRDIAFHFNPRWDDPYNPVVVRNHRRGGTWGGEERQQPHFPLHKGGNFEILILNEQSEWKVAVNGQHFISFPHHFPSHQVDYLSIGGEVQINAVKIF